MEVRLQDNFGNKFVIVIKWKWDPSVVIAARSFNLDSGLNF